MTWLNPYIWLGFLLALLGSFGTGYYNGDKHAHQADAEASQKAQQAAQTKVEAVDTAREAVAAKREGSREQIRIVYRTIREKTNEIQVDASAAVAGSCDLSADGLRLWNAANAAGTTETLRSQPDSALSGAAAGTIGTQPRAAAQPYRSNGDVRAVSGSDGQAGGVRE